MRILAISGSLRAQSTNTTLLQALRSVAPAGVAVVVYTELHQIPLFNPDLETASLPPVIRWRAALADADALVISSPEYAHGIPGALKNALDWVVGSGELSRKRVGLLHASGRGVHAQASLRDILTTMDAVLMPGADVTIELLGQSRTAEEIAADPAHRAALTAFLAALTHAPGPS